MATGSENGRQPRPARRGTRALALVRTALTLGTVALALAVLHGDRDLFGPRPAASPRAVPVAPDGSLPAPAVSLDGRPGHAPPVEISIPVIGVRSRLARLGVTPGGTLQQPPKPGTAGWYDGGPRPGDAGPPALIIGPADPAAGGSAVFARLGELRPGNSVLVRAEDGSTAAFEVYRVAGYPGPGLPSGQVYAAGPRAELRLVTCPAGPGRGGVIAYAVLRTPAPPEST